MAGFAASGTITVDGIKKTKCLGFNSIGCVSMMSAKRNVLKGLANKLRAHLEGVEGWTQWRHLTEMMRDYWLDEVIDILQWEVLEGGKIARLHALSAHEFGNTLIRGLA